MVEASEYLVHKVDRLWREVEELRKKVEELEKRIAQTQLTQHPGTSVQAPQPVTQPESPHMDPVLRILREKGPMNIIQLNEALREVGISETVRDTLFKRLKKLMEEGKVGFDEKTQNFFIR